MNTTPPPMRDLIPLLDSQLQGQERVFTHSQIKARDAQWMERITKLEADRKMLREALKGLLDDTQHAEHPDCDDGPCPVREARAALESKP